MRPAHITPSGFSKVMTSGRKKEEVFGKTAYSYAEEIVQMMLGVEPDNFMSYDMQRGIELEPLAVRAYEKANMVLVYGKKRYVHNEHEFISGEPDGLVGKVGIIEVKSPNQNNHFKNLIEGYQIDQYKWQIQGYMWLLDREWCDFCSYNPDYPGKYELSINRVVRDDEMISELESRCIEFWNDIVLPLKKRVEAL